MAPVLITGAAVLTPLAEDIDGFRQALLAGRSAVTRGADGFAGAWLDGFDLGTWSARHLAAEPVEAARLRKTAGRAARPAQSAGCVAMASLRGAGLAVDGRVGLLVAGANLALAHQANAVLGHARRPGGLRASYALTHLDVDVTGVVSELTGIRREGWAVGVGSASGTVAVIQAARMLAAGWLDQCLVVAPLAELSATELEAFRRTGALAEPNPGESYQALCRPFDTHRRGFVYGQAAAAVVLERAGPAAARGAQPLAEVAGYGQVLDARRGTGPDSAGQVAAIRAALSTAGVCPGEVDYVNAHGTGSVLGDETEARSLGTVFAGHRPLVNSTKALVGHCLSGAGVVELVATVLQMRAGVCHPNPNLDTPLVGDLALVGRHAVEHSIRAALTTSFSFGGVSAALLLRAAE